MPGSVSRETPPLSVVIPARGGLAEAAPALEKLVPIARACGAEVVVAGGAEEAPEDDVTRVVPMPVDDIHVLRRRGIIESRGDVIAIGEDHAVPRPDWCTAVIRAHAEHPDTPAVVGCLENATDSTVSGRANFLAFAAEWQGPLPTMPGERPPPSSALSVKRSAVAEIHSRPPGWFEADLLPALFAEGSMIADDRIVVDHHQDHGVSWSIRNAFHSSRSSYGYAGRQLDGPGRRRVARWTIGGIAGRARRQARIAAEETGIGVRESALITTIGVANGLGGAVGTLFGPGRSAERVA